MARIPFRRQWHPIGEVLTESPLAQMHSAGQMIEELQGRADLIAALGEAKCVRVYWDPKSNRIRTDNVYVPPHYRPMPVPEKTPRITVTDIERSRFQSLRVRRLKLDSATVDSIDGLRKLFDQPVRLRVELPD